MSERAKEGRDVGRGKERGKKRGRERAGKRREVGKTERAGGLVGR